MNVESTREDMEHVAKGVAGRVAARHEDGQDLRAKVEPVLCLFDHFVQLYAPGFIVPSTWSISFRSQALECQLAKSGIDILVHL